MSTGCDSERQVSAMQPCSKDELRQILSPLECPVCLELKPSSTVCNLGHSVCNECIRNWSAPKKCALCRQPWSMQRPNVGVNQMLASIGITAPAAPAAADAPATPPRPAVEREAPSAPERPPRLAGAYHNFLARRTAIDDTNRENHQRRLLRAYISLRRIARCLRGGSNSEELVARWREARDTLVLKIASESQLYSSRYGGEYRPLDSDLRRNFLEQQAEGIAAPQETLERLQSVGPSIRRRGTWPARRW